MVRLILCLLAVGCMPALEKRVFVDNLQHDADGDGFTEDEGDCDDTDDAVFPDATEVCDAVDNDCNGEIDDDATDATLWYLDADGDGYGWAGVSVLACAQPDNHVGPDFDGDGAADYDCNDTTGAVNPAAAETCDSIDNDCDGLVDDADDSLAAETTWYRDEDADGFGIIPDSVDTGGPDDEESPDAFTTQACINPPGYVSQSGDCDDTNWRVNPHEPEWCDGIDNDCDESTDDDPENPAEWFHDADGDGYGSERDTIFSCEVPDGYVGIYGDCDDENERVAPDQTEVCDGEDNDCDGITDEDGAEGAATFYRDADGDGYGDVGSAVVACVAPVNHVSNADDCDDGRIEVNPAATETCATPSIDDDCNGIANEDGADLCTRFFVDDDGDGRGATEGVDPISKCLCIAEDAAPGAYTALTSGDCDDDNALRHAGMPESCGTLWDDDCDEDTNDEDAIGCSLFYMDADLDGYGPSFSSDLVDGSGDGLLLEVPIARCFWR